MLSKKIKELAANVAEERSEQRETLDSYSSDEDELFKILHDAQVGDKDLQTLFNRLNYQRVVDKMDKDVNRWKWGVLIFSTVTVLGLYIWGSSYETIISKEHGLNEYEQLMATVNFETNYHKDFEIKYSNKDSTEYDVKLRSITPIEKPNVDVLQNATESYLNIYFLRYILIRLVMIVVLITLITAGIKVYMRMRKDRMVLTVKEEGTTTILYLFKKFLSIKKEEDQEYSKNAQKLIADMLPAIINQLYHIPSAKDVTKDKFSISHKMMGIMEKIATNQRSSDK